MSNADTWQRKHGAEDEKSQAPEGGADTQRACVVLCEWWHSSKMKNHELHLLMHSFIGEARGVGNWGHTCA